MGAVGPGALGLLVVEKNRTLGEPLFFWKRKGKEKGGGGEKGDELGGPEGRKKNVPP